MSIGSILGRLARPYSNTSTFRWMGCTMAMYQGVFPAESGLRDLIIPSEKIKSPRKNRRGSRSKRGGRKRRALAGDAPSPSGSSTSSKLPRIGRLEKRELKTRAVLEKLVRVAQLAHRLIPVFSDASRWPERQRVFVRLRNARRSWMNIQSGRAYGSAGMWNARWEISVHGIDTGSRRAGVDPPPWVYDSRGLKVYRKQKVIPKISVEKDDAPYECSKCQRKSRQTVCRVCGGDLVGRRPLPKRFGLVAQLPRSSALPEESVLGPAGYSSRAYVEKSSPVPLGQLGSSSGSKGTGKTRPPRR
jgi:hypothetical protein